MQTSLEMALGHSGERVRNLQHVQRVADAMYPNPTEWEFTGQVVDGKGGNAHCSCGHPIRYIFVIERKRDGQALPIGSTCITSTVPYLQAHGAANLATALEQALADHLKALAEMEKAQRAAEQDAVCQLACREWESVRDHAREIVLPMKQRGLWIPRGIWYLWYCGKVHVCPTYSRVSSRIAWYRKATASIREAFGSEGYRSL